MRLSCYKDLDLINESKSCVLNTVQRNYTVRENIGKFGDLTGIHQHFT